MNGSGKWTYQGENNDVERERQPILVIHKWNAISVVLFSVLQEIYYFRYTPSTLFVDFNICSPVNEKGRCTKMGSVLDETYLGQRSLLSS